MFANINNVHSTNNKAWVTIPLKEGRHREQRNFEGEATRAVSQPAKNGLQKTLKRTPREPSKKTLTPQCQLSKSKKNNAIFLCRNPQQQRPRRSPCNGCYFSLRGQKEPIDLPPQSMCVPAKRHSAFLFSAVPSESNVLPVVALLLELGDTILQLIESLHLSLTGLASCKSVARSLHGDCIVGVLDNDRWEGLVSLARGNPGNR